MFLSIHAIPVGVLTNTVVIPKKSYSKVAMTGSGTFDGLHLQNIELSDATVLSLNTEESFGSHTLFLANFQNTLAAGNYISIGGFISKWIVKRKLVGNFTPKTLAELDGSQTTYTDMSQGNRKEYEYQVIPIAEDGTEGRALVAISESDFFGWYLCSEDNTKYYKFDLNIESESILLNTDIKLFESNTKYPIQRIGKRKYHSGGLSTMPYSMNGNSIVINNELLREVEDFINDGSTKLLKNTSGDIFKVQTSEFSYQYLDTISEQPYTINFKWVEVGDED